MRLNAQHLNPVRLFGALNRVCSACRVIGLRLISQPILFKLAMVAPRVGAGRPAYQEVFADPPAGFERELPPASEPSATVDLLARRFAVLAVRLPEPLHWARASRFP